ncbi:MAG: RNA methyltransferase [Chlamydiia bacterium]|nr:RNA methyltransferase [Chlamydiia bacterium]
MITNEIKSLQHPIVKHLVKLRKEKHYRLEKKAVLLEGKKMISEYRGPITMLLTSESPLSHPNIREIVNVSYNIIEKIAATPSPEPYLAEVPLPKWQSLKGKKRLLALDGVSDPGNLGTLLRSALAFGFEGVFLTSNSADPFSPKALRAAKGATFLLPLMWGPEEELLTLIEEEQLIPLVADASGSSWPPSSAPFILILGNESSGPSPSFIEKGTLLSIPIAKETESLNVAIAGSILMHKLQESAWTI